MKVNESLFRFSSDPWGEASALFLKGQQSDGPLRSFCIFLMHRCSALVWISTHISDFFISDSNKFGFQVTDGGLRSFKMTTATNSTKHGWGWRSCTVNFQIRHLWNCHISTFVKGIKLTAPNNLCHVYSVDWKWNVFKCIKGYIDNHFYVDKYF